MIPPCDRNCPKRRAYPNCHGTCKKYIEFVRKREKYLAKKRLENLICEYIDQAKKRR